MGLACKGGEDIFAYFSDDACEFLETSFSLRDVKGL